MNSGRVDTGGAAARACVRIVRRLALPAVVALFVALACRSPSLAQSNPTPQTAPPAVAPAPAVSTAASPATPAQAAPAPADKNAPEMATHDTPATFTAKVNLVLVRVVVRDGKGSAVGTLKQEDFQVFDKGKLQVISKFALERGGAAAAQMIHAEPAPGEPPAAPEETARAMPDRFVAYLFDDLHLAFADLARMRDGAMRHLEQLAPTTRAAIYSTSGQTTLEFTGDRDQLRTALLRLQPRSRTVADSVECPHVGYFMANAIINRNDDTALAAATADAVGCLGCAPDDARCVAIAQQQAQSAAQRALSTGEFENRMSLNVIKDVIRRLSAMPGQRAIVLLSPGFYVIDDHRFDEQEVIDRAIRASVQISALDARGLYTVIAGGDASERSPSVMGIVLKTRYQQQAAMVDGDVMAELASGTGGLFFQNSNDVDAGFQRTAAAPEYYYVLGFTPRNLKLDGSYHALKVALKNGKGLDLQARRGYYAPKHELDPALEAKRELEEAMFSRDEMQDIPIEVHTQFFKPAPETAKLAIVARVNIKGLHFDKVEDRNHDTLTVVSGVFDRDGNFVNGVEKTIIMRLRDNTLHALQASGISTKTSFDVTPGSYVVRVVVRDQQGRLMAARNGVVEIP